MCEYCDDLKVITKELGIDMIPMFGRENLLKEVK